MENLISLKLEGNPFCKEYPTFKNYIFKDMYKKWNNKNTKGSSKNLEGFRLDNHLLNMENFGQIYDRNKDYWKDWDKIERVNEKENGKKNDDEEDLDDKTISRDFGKYRDLISKCIINPLKSKENLNKLLAKVSMLIEGDWKEKRGEVFDDLDGNLEGDIKEFLKDIRKLIESQDDTQSILIEILSK